jgi:polysaccharide export outer membrane protein
MNTRVLTCCLGITGLVLACGCQHTPKYASLAGLGHSKSSLQMTPITNRIESVWMQPPTNLFTLGPGDKLEIELIDETNSITTTVVGPDGKVYFNLLSGLDVWGLTLGQTKSEMENALGKYVREQPRVNLTVREVNSKNVWLLGRFQQPGVYPLPGPMTLLEAISMAGGSQLYIGAKDAPSQGPLGEELADLRHSFVVRNGKFLPIDLHRLVDLGDLSQNIYLQPDDLIYFAPAYSKEVYVLGAVTQPHAVNYVGSLTLLGAIAGAYGTIRDAQLSHVTIVRGSLAQPEVAVVDYYDIVKGRAQDIPLEPQDIVYVPFSPYRYLRKYAEIALNTFVSSVAINAGSRAVIGRSSGGSGGIVIPVGSGIQIIPPTAPPIH